MGLNVTGEQMIFRQDKQGKDGPFATYSTAISKKMPDGSWKSDYYDVIFVKDVKNTVLENKTKINITDAFLSFRVYQDKPYKEIVVQGFEYLEGAPAREPSGFAALTNDDVPF